MSDVKIFAMYLPQYHVIEENSRFWGEGFTDWTGVRNSQPLFCGHRQPKIPLNRNYYDLSNASSIRWQCRLAKKAGLAGFAVYHYWFNDNQNLLTTPSEIILNNTDIDISFFFAWDNTSWVRSWSRIKGNDWFPAGDKKNSRLSGSQVLVRYEAGGKEQWRHHFEYLLLFFKDKRYEKKENKPLFMILNPGKEIIEMAEFWNHLAVRNGFAGMYFIYRHDAVHMNTNALIKNKPVFRYEPGTSGWNDLFSRLLNRLQSRLGIEKLKKYDYDAVWKKIISYAVKNENKNMYYCAFTGYDDTPRRGKNGRTVTGGSAQKFRYYLEKLVSISREQKKDYMFLTAWNEWGEGAFLEPDEDEKYDYLKAVRAVTDI